jgi:hypothetical protein
LGSYTQKSGKETRMTERPGGILLLLLFFIPLIAVTGGIIVAIVKTVHQERQVELAQRERIAAIERGIDPAKLPPIRSGDDLLQGSASMRAHQQSQGLLVGGIITLAIGIGLTILFTVTEEEGEAWAIGILPICIGLGLLVSAWLVRPRMNGSSSMRS